MRDQANGARARDSAQCDRAADPGCAPREGDPMLMARLSPTDVRPRAQAALENSPITELRDLQVEQQSGAIVISGNVSSFYHKQLAQEVVWALCKDLEVDLVNVIRVS